MTSPVVLITGAITGIGRATAFAFAKAGARLVVSGRDRERGLALATEIQQSGADIEFVHADVRHEQDVRQLVDHVVYRFGRLDAAVNNAGVEGSMGKVVEQTPETYAATFDTNVLGTLLCMKHELRVMLPHGRGSIVNLSSSAGRRGRAGAAVLVASKHAVEGLTKAAALEVAGSGIRVNAVAPGPVDTGMLDRYTGGDDGKARLKQILPVQRLGRPEEVAEAIVFVAIGKADFIVGHSLAVDGGYTV